jgi:hypothetical protein
LDTVFDDRAGRTEATAAAAASPAARARADEDAATAASAAAVVAATAAAAVTTVYRGSSATLSACAEHAPSTVAAGTVTFVGRRFPTCATSGLRASCAAVTSGIVDQGVVDDPEDGRRRDRRIGIGARGAAPAAGAAADGPSSVNCNRMRALERAAMHWVRCRKLGRCSSSTSVFLPWLMSRHAC